MEGIVGKVILGAIALFLIIIIFGTSSKNQSSQRYYWQDKKQQPQQKQTYQQPQSNTYASGTPVQETVAKGHDYTGAYKPKWMFTYNEKTAYWKIKAVTDKKGLYLFAKVRLFDLIEPKRDAENYKGAMWKIQAKHVDFVICDKNLVARYIIELDDSSHEAAGRSERDEFVDAVLRAAGYKVIRLNAVDAATLEAALSSTV